MKELFEMKVKSINLFKTIFIISILLIYAISRYFQSFFAGIFGYGSGDAYRVVLDAFTIENNKFNSYLIAYFYKIAHEITGISYNQVSFYITPLVGFIIIFLIFDLIRRELGFISAALTTLFLVLNPWLSYNSTEPSKEIFVILFMVSALYTLFRFEKTKLTTWLIISNFFIAVGINFYHSMFIFLPFYLLTEVYFLAQIYKDKRPIKYILRSVFIFTIIIGIIVLPVLIINQIGYKISASEKPAFLKTDIDAQGNIYQRQLGAMFHAIFQDQQKLGIFNLTNGIYTFILNQYEIIYLFFAMSIISLILFLKKKIYMPLIFSLLTIYTYIIIGLQFTSYSHTSRYPQYIVYFLILTAGLIFGWIVSMLENMKFKLLVLSLILIAEFLIFNPFTKIDIYRSMYASQYQTGEHSKLSNINIDKNNQILYLGWPSVTLSLLENYNLNSTDDLNTFGWGLIDLKGISSKRYVKEKNIKYFVYNAVGSDYFNSNEIVFNYLKSNFPMTPVSYVTEDKQSIIIYKINTN